MPRCMISGCVFGAKYRPVVEIPLQRQSGHMSAPAILLHEDGVCGRCVQTISIRAAYSREKILEFDDRQRKQGFYPKWRDAAMYFVDVAKTKHWLTDAKIYYPEMVIECQRVAVETGRPVISEYAKAEEIHDLVVEVGREIISGVDLKALIDTSKRRVGG